MDEEIKDDAHNLLFGVRRSIRYNNRRRSFFDAYNLFTNSFSILMGSSVLYVVLNGLDDVVTATLSLLLITASTLNMLVNTSVRAREHEALSRRFIQLEKKIIAHQNPVQEEVSAWMQERLDIEADEPPVKHILNAICHNELAKAMGYADQHMAKISLPQRLLAQFFDYRAYTLRVTA